MNYQTESQTELNQIDEFGRDMSLRRPTLHDRIIQQKNDLIDRLYLKGEKKMSWAEFGYEMDELEEMENVEKRKLQVRAFTLERKSLLATGNYELEDGEIIE
jgi:hypothetical protein